MESRSVLKIPGRDVTYTHSDGTILRGKVVDYVKAIENYPDRDFLDLIELIRWEDGSQGIRFCYYVRKHGESKWRFANRPLSIGADKLAELLRKAKMKKWFP